MIILGSKSPRRKMLFENKISKHFLTYAPNIDEDASNVLIDPILIVRDIEKRKAIEVNKIYKDDIIITADTIVVLNTIVAKGVNFSLFKNFGNITAIIGAIPPKIINKATVKIIIKSLL